MRMRGALPVVWAIAAALGAQESAPPDRDLAWVRGTRLVLERELPCDGQRLPAVKVPWASLAFSGDGSWLAVCLPPSVPGPGGWAPALALVRPSDGAIRTLDTEQLRQVIGPGDGEGVLAIGRTDAFEVTPSDGAVRSLGFGLGGERPLLLTGGRAGARGDDNVLLWWSYLFGGPVVGVARRGEVTRTCETRPRAVRTAVREPCTGRVAVSQYLPGCMGVGTGVGHTLTMFSATRELRWQHSTRAQPLAFSWDGTTLIVQDGGVVALDASIGRALARHENGAVWWAQVDPVLAISHDRETLTLWDAPRLRSGRTFDPELPRWEPDPTIPILASPGSILAAAVAPDGARLAVLGSDRCLVYRIAH